jgi:hypothetical protein
MASSAEAFVFPGDRRVGRVGRVGRVALPPGASKYEAAFACFRQLGGACAPGDFGDFGLGDFGLGDVSVVLHYQLQTRPEMYAQVLALDRTARTPVNQHVADLIGRPVWGPCLLVFLRQTEEPVNVRPGEVVPEEDRVYDEEAVDMSALLALLGEAFAGGESGVESGVESCGGPAYTEGAVALLERARLWELEDTPAHERAEQALQLLERAAGGAYCG